MTGSMRPCAQAIAAFLLGRNFTQQISDKQAKCHYAQKAQRDDGGYRQPRQFHGG
jgi:hypothetical protein